MTTTPNDVTAFFLFSPLVPPTLWGTVDADEERVLPSLKSFVLLGHPVRHSASAPMMTAAFRAAGLQHTYSPLDLVRPEGLKRAVQLIRDGSYDGANVTLPYKRDVLKLVDRVDATAERVGAANVIALDEKRRLVAYNTDVGALVAELREATSGRRRAAIIGAGGAALAAVAACKELDFAVVGVTTRSWPDTAAIYESETAERVRALGGIAAVWPSGSKAPASTKLSTEMRLQFAELARFADVVVQATSAGMAGGPPGDAVAAMVPFEGMSKDAVAFDLVYRPALTPFLLAAERAGLRAISGLGMLVRQAEATYKIWLGQDPPPGVMRRAAEVVVSSPV